MQQPISKIKAHKAEIYDIAFSSSNRDAFITCGKDGSIRLFDQRCIDRYSTIHQDESNRPILRVAWNPINSMTVAYITDNSSEVSLVDIRSQQQQLNLSSHLSSVNAIDWSPTEENFLMSSGQDARVCVVLLLSP